MLEVSNAEAGYGGPLVLHDVSINVGDGEIVTLVGKNGAGKTTLLHTIMGLHRLRSGSVTFDGRSIESLRADQRARLGLGYVPDDRGIYANLSVEENLTLSPVHGPAAWTIDAVYETFPRLYERRTSRGTHLSGGEQQMLAIARVLRMGSSLLLCDEPTEGLAPVIVDRIEEIFESIKARGTSVLLVEQNLHFATRIADRHYFIEDGAIRREVSNAEVLGQEKDFLEFLGV